MDAEKRSENETPREGGYGSPTPEDETVPGTAPSADADMDAANTEQEPERKEFSSESDAEGSGLDDA
ncbi:hypothetical protein GCM10027449_32140 [Sinomonas notoginsengisoli]|uniref:hypothetical protein n=1 Tax=Sinomonas notoginsengisoli TaxID=1457311 RepID=UPI001F25071B|nr:hypothetical protein [Sinomonas notoginsengisoli]